MKSKKNMLNSYRLYLYILFVTVFSNFSFYGNTLNYYDYKYKKNLIADPNLSSLTAVNAGCDADFIVSINLITAAPGEEIGFFSDQNLTQRISNGTVNGVDYNTTISGSTYTLNITNLATQKIIYAARVDALGTVLTAVADAPFIVLTPNYGNYILPTLTGCGSVDLLTALTTDLNLRNDSDIIQLYDSNNNRLNSSIVNQSGTYKIEVNSNGCIVDRNVVVTVNEAANLTVTNPQILLLQGEIATINSSSNNGSVISFYDVTNNRVTSSALGPYNTAGNYVVRVDATKGTCVTSEFVYITVDNASVCKVITERVYADEASKFLFGIVTDLNNAVDGDTDTFATVSLPIGLAGAFFNFIDIKFTQPVPKGKPIIIKLGNEVGGLDVLSGATLTTLIKDGNDIETNGTPQSINANLLGLLNGTNQYEVSFMPNPTNSNSEVHGVRIYMTSLLSLAQNLRVYDAYYYSNTPHTTCDNEVIDVLSGTKGYGVNLVNATVGVSDPRNFYDGNAATFTQMYGVINVAAEAYLTPVYSSYSSKDDVIEMVVSNPNTVLDVNLLGALTYRKFDRETPVGPLTSVDTNILDLTLLSGSTDKYVLRIAGDGTSASWDRFELRFGAVANVLAFLNIYSIKRIPKVEFIGIPPQNSYTFCVGQDLTVEPQECTTFKWYSQPTGTNSLLSSTGTYQIPSNAVGAQTYYVQAIRDNCEVLDRYAVTFTVGTAIASQNVTATHNFNPPSNCAGNLTLSATIASTITTTNPYFQWYKSDRTGQTLIPGENQSTLNLTNLPEGEHVYYVGVGSDEYCLTAAADRKEVRFIVPRLNRATDFTTSNSINSCNTLNLTITANSTLTNVVYKWYFDSQGINEITTGTVGTLTYTVTGNQLNIDGLGTVQTNLTYYATLSSDQTCLNTKDLRQVNVNYVPDPLLNVLVPGPQVFCPTVTATLADIRLNYQDIVWYDTATGGSQLPASTVLTDNTTYYATRLAYSTCPSISRLPVEVNFNAIPAPNLPTTQTFCSTQNAMVADLDTNNYNVVWKNSTGTILLASEVLVDGNQYYAYNVPSIGCESFTATLVTVSISTPTISNQSPTILVCDTAPNLTALTDFNNANWYSDAAKTVQLLPGDVLQNGMIYYSTSEDFVTCQTINYLATVRFVPEVVTISESTGSTKICVNQEYTYSAPLGFNTYNWSVTNATIVRGGTISDATITLVWNTEGMQTLSLTVDALSCLQSNAAQISGTVETCADLAVSIIADNIEPYYLGDVTFTIRVANLSAVDFNNVVIDLALNSGFEFKSFNTLTGTYDRHDWLIATINANQTVEFTLTAKVLEQGSYEQRVELTSSLPVDTNVTNNVDSVQILPKLNECLIVYNEISPNSDGMNDYFTISCLQNYPQTKLEIYNRYGSLVYKNNNYDNSFNGYANVSGTFAGKELPSGTYFYTLQFTDGVTSKKSGWLYIMR